MNAMALVLMVLLAMASMIFAVGDFVLFLGRVTAPRIGHRWRSVKPSAGR